jgi:membrane protease YdiL (CAAX protease family)
MQQPDPISTENILSPVAAPVKPGLWSAWATFGLSVAIFSINGVAQTIVMLIFAVRQAIGGYSLSDPAGIQSFLQDLITNGQMLSLAIIVSAVAGIAMTVLFIKIRKGFSVAEYLGLKAINLKTVLVLVVIFLVMLGLSLGFGMLVNSTQESDIFSEGYRNTPWPLVFWLAIVVFGPVYEEILFRGFLFVGLRQSALGTAGTIVVTGLVFALLHAAQYGAAVIAQIFILGIVFGVVRWKSGSLWSTIFLHGLWNLGQMVLMTSLPTLGS